jgi:Protein of unknown function (DUF2637)
MRAGQYAEQYWPASSPRCGQVCGEGIRLRAEARASEPTAGGAVRFFWVWLMLATGVSVAGNVAHAVLTAPMGTVRLAAAAAVVPPAVLLGSTHSVALLVRAHRVGLHYWCALAMTFALAGCAFVLSFDALRDLAGALGMPPDRAWLWPVAIDVSIANSTLALLSLAPARAAQRPAGPRGAATRSTSGKPAGRSAVSHRTGALGPGPAPGGAAVMSAQRALAAVPDGVVDSVDPAMLMAWQAAADELVRSGVTSKDPRVVAAVLAEHAAGTSRGTIGRRLAIHHQTVGRILAGAQGLTG